MASLPGNPGHETQAPEGFVQPSSYLRPRGQSQPMPHVELESAIERDQRIGLVCAGPRYDLLLFAPPTTLIPHIPNSPAYQLQYAWPDADDSPAQQRIRDFLKVRTSYDVLPLSFRLIIFDTSLLVKKSLTILIQNGRLKLQPHGDLTEVDYVHEQASCRRHYGTPIPRPLQAY